MSGIWWKNFARLLPDNSKVKKCANEILGMEKAFAQLFDVVDTQVVDPTLQIFPLYAIISSIKMVVITIVFVVSVFVKDGTLENIFSHEHYEGVFQTDENGLTEAGWMDVLVCVHLISGFLTSYFGRLAVNAPLLLATPAACALQLCLELFEVSDLWYPTIPDAVTTNLIIIGIVCGTFSFIILSEHIWADYSTTYALDRQIMILPGYRAMFTSLDVILNRNTVDIEEVETYEERVSRLTVNFDRSRTTIKTALWNKGQTIPMVFVCTTLWHENEAEMTTLLTSLIRLIKTVEDRRAKNLSDFYNIEVHILFDNCYELWTDDAGNQHKVVNFFVKQFKRILKKLVVQERVSEVINTEVLMVTPYGGRIDYMFGHTSMHVHLKDAELVQKGKRWSQVMYMYYLIGWKMDACKYSMPGGQGKSEHLERKKTYILALDGDVRFKPSALELCLERMLRNDKVAAVCGRIHPVGGGWINWYQRFEYGVGHWLQKATEHVLGCVLCSPGCFSLMRVHHLRFNNVMARYRQYAETPMQKLQYDMGEDRWLCTLMLMQGGRIEYEAGSHCYTFAPEELEEFFKQRKRWGPSTTANIYDLVQQQWLARKNNPYISFPYVCYQGFNLIFTIIGLSTTLMMLSEAFNFAIKMPTDQAALAYIIICGPVVIFALVCRFYDNQNVQIGLASFLTFIYAILMVTVMIGLLVDAIACVADPNVLFFLALAVIYGIAALSHGEIVNLICGLIYFMFIPSCFIFLQLYMVSNLNDISWGTRQNAGEASTKKKDMGIFGGMMNSFCSMCLGETSCKECCCPNEIKSSAAEEDLELTRNSLKKDTVIFEEPKMATPVTEQHTQTDQSSEDNEDIEDQVFKEEIIHEDGWFDFSHRLRRHSDLELHSSSTAEAGEIKKRYTTAELGFNIRDKGFDYTKKTSVPQKKKSSKKAAQSTPDSVQIFTPLPAEKLKPDSSTHTKRLTKRRVTNSIRKDNEKRQSVASVVSSKSACSLRKSLLKHNKSFNELIDSQYKDMKKVLTIDIDDSSRDTELVKRSYLNYGGVTRKTMRKLFQLIKAPAITEPIHLSLLLEYFTYPTKSKSPVPRATHHETIKIRKIRQREYSECAMRGNLDYFSWFLEPNAPFEPATRIYTLADPEYNFWKSLQDPQNGHLKLVDSEYSDVDKERLQNERQKALDKFRNDIFLFYVVANILWMTIGIMLRQFGDRLLQIGYDAPDFCEPDTEAQISFSSFSHFSPRDSLLPGGPGLFPGINGSEPTPDNPSYQIEIQPLTLCFMAFYIILIVVQFICMISHRISTFYHYMAHIRIPDERRTIKDKRLKLEKQRLKRVNEQPRDSELSGDGSAVESDDSLDELADHIDKSGRRMSDESVFAEITHLKKGLNNPSFASPVDVEIDIHETSFTNDSFAKEPVNPYPTKTRGVKFAVGEENNDKTSRIRKTGAWALTKKSALKKQTTSSESDNTSGPATVAGTPFSNHPSGTDFSSAPVAKKDQEEDPLMMFKDLDMGDSSTVRLPSATMKKSNSTGTLF